MLAEIHETLHTHACMLTLIFSKKKQKFAH